jgi:rfaE bifunctional protein kinase chain/domain
MKKINNIVFVSGNFNIIHPGHLRLLQFAKELGSKLIVGVFSDEISGTNAHIKEGLRLKNIESLTWVDQAFIIYKDLNSIITKIKPDIIVKGKEHENKINPEIESLKKYGGKLIFSSGESMFSSFDLINQELEVSKSSSFFNTINEFKIVVNNLKKHLSKISKLKVIVIGDTIIDEYITCEALGMSQEDPTIVVTPVKTDKFIGGAAIVAAHAAGLGANVDLISVCGYDENSLFAISKLKTYKVNAYFFKDKARPTTLKKRYRCKGKTMLRVSHLHQGMIDSEIQAKILHKFKNIIKNTNLVIFSDFNYGCLPTILVSKLVNLCLKYNVKIVADSQSSSQVGDISRFKNMDIITPTEREARLSLQDYDSGLVILAEKLRKTANPKNILLKLGENGVLVNYYKNNWNTEKISAFNQYPIDVAGAGDSMLVTTSLAYTTGASIIEATILGSISSSIQVGRVGNYPIETSNFISFFNAIEK